jgi:hypothetical protein
MKSAHRAVRHGRRIAIAVLTVAATPAAAMSQLDALLATTARTAYDELAA